MPTLTEIKELIEHSTVFLGTADMRAQPHIIAVGEVRVLGPQQVIITDNYMVRTIANIRENHDVALAVIGRDQAGYKLHGQAILYTAGNYLEYVKNMRENQGLPAKGAIVVHITGIRKM